MQAEETKGLPIRAFLILMAIMLSGGITRAAHVPQPDPTLGDGGVSPFYTWTGDIPGAPGRMLRIEPLDPVLGLKASGGQFRILRGFAAPSLADRGQIGHTARVTIAGSGAHHLHSPTVQRGHARA